MGTRSTVKFYDDFDKGDPILSVYQQFDGYIDGVGHKLANFLKDKKIINGISGGQTMQNGYANGMGCLAAQYVVSEKTKIGGFYLVPEDTSESYNYEVRLIGGKLIIKVDDFEGSPEELLKHE